MTYNSIPPFISARSQDNQEAIGITQQPQGDEDSWYQIIGGLIFQGGKQTGLAVDTAVAVSFVFPFPKKVLGIFLEPIDDTIIVGAEHSHSVSNISLTQFNLVNDSGGDTDYYWWAIGY